jgi:hypothetical protein
MLAPQAVQTPRLQRALTIGDSALSMGLLNIGARGSGKTTLLALLALQHLRKGTPQVLIDPLGTLSEPLLFLLLRSLQHVPFEQHAAIWQKLRYIDVGNANVVTPFPIYYTTSSDTLREVAERFIATLRLANPRLATQASVTWPSLRRVGINTGMVLVALGYQLTEAEDLLVHTSEWEKQGLFDEAIRRNPEAVPAVAYFREQYLPLSRSAKNQLTSTFLDHMFTFALDPKLRTLFGASTPGITWEDVEQQHQTVILDFKNVTDPETRRFAMLWIFKHLYEHIKTRGRRTMPLGVCIDEFADLTQQVTDTVNPLATLFDTFIQRYMRNNRIFLSIAFQSISQVDEQLRNTLLSLGTYVFGKQATMAEARILADVLFQTDPFRVKHYRKVWGKDDLELPASGAVREEILRLMGNMREIHPTYPYYVLDYEPEHMPLPEQLELASQQLTNLGLFRFLCRPALREGEVSQSVIPINIASIVRDKKTGEYVFADQELVERVRSRLAKRSGISAANHPERAGSTAEVGTRPRNPTGSATTAASSMQWQAAGLLFR